MSIITKLPNNLNEYINYDDLLKIGDIMPVCYEYVDMGSAGKWATCNLGASLYYEPGLRFQWGDTQGYRNNGVKDFIYDVYKFADLTGWRSSSDSYKYTKYNSIDRKVALDLEDDAVNKIMGGNWRTPKHSDFANLRGACNLTAGFDTNSKTYVITFTLKTDINKKIHFPTTFFNNNNNELLFGAYYWTRVLCDDYTKAYSAYMTSSVGDFDYTMATTRFTGLPIRGILDI